MKLRRRIYSNFTRVPEIVVFPFRSWSAVNSPYKENKNSYQTNLLLDLLFATFQLVYLIHKKSDSEKSEHFFVLPSCGKFDLFTLSPDMHFHFFQLRYNSVKLTEYPITQLGHFAYHAFVSCFRVQKNCRWHLRTKTVITTCIKYLII